MPLTDEHGREVVPLRAGETPDPVHKQVTRLTHGGSGTTFDIERNVTVPYLTVYPAVAAGSAGVGMVVCPGGAFRLLAVDHEGEAVARWLNARGITAFVLRYRVGATPVDDESFLAAMSSGEEGTGQPTVPLDQVPLAAEDGRQAIRVVRQRAAQWGVRPDRIGIIGFSAGALVAGSAAMEDDRDSRPDFAAIIYGALLEQATAPADACPLFITLASDDELGPVIVESCLAIYSAWQRAGHPVELHAYSRGNHGFGMIHQGLPADGWPDRFADWLVDLNLLPG